MQAVISNLKIAHIEVRSDESLDIRPYIHGRQVDRIVVPMGDCVRTVREPFLHLLGNSLTRLCSNGVFYERDPDRVRPYLATKNACLPRV